WISQKHPQVQPLSISLSLSLSLSLSQWVSDFSCLADCIVKALSLRDSSIPCQSTLSSLSRSYNQTFLLCKLWIWRKLEDVG
ncbi:hypothetical protein GIB67_023182, partial [Kingdonia uniflora]